MRSYERLNVKKDGQFNGVVIMRAVSKSRSGVEYVNFLNRRYEIFARKVGEENRFIDLAKPLASTKGSLPKR
jgi:hypothetical protein